MARTDLQRLEASSRPSSTAQQQQHEHGQLHHPPRTQHRRPSSSLKRRNTFIVHSSSDASSLTAPSSVIDSLDLGVPWNRDLERIRFILEDSIEEALDKLQSYQLELSTDDEEGDSDDTASETGSCSVSAASEKARSPLLSSSCTFSSSSKRDTETLQAFLDDVYELLSSIRQDVHDQLPSMPLLPTMSAIIPGHFDKRAVLEALASNYGKAQEVLLQLSLYSPLSISLPEFPANLAASISSAAKGALAAASTQSSYPFNSSGTTSVPCSPSTLTSQAVSAPPSALPKTHSSFSLPQPPVSAIRAFLQSESRKLSLKIPASITNLKRPSLQDWSTTSSNMVTKTLSNAYNDATHFVHDEKEKLKDYIHDEKEKLTHYMKDEAEKLGNALFYGKSRLLEFHELPADWRNNKYILSGYRFIPADRPGELFLSAFKWHNETMNIYTHLIPAAYIIYYIFQVFPHTPLGDSSLNTLYDRSANLAFLLASLICLGLSAAWHLAAGCGTYSVFHSCATLDYLGISALISTSIISLTHAGFRCNPAMDSTYNLATSIFGALGMYLPWKPWFNDREHKNVRIAFFVFLACVGAAPMVHMVFLYGGKLTWQFYSPVFYSLLAYKIGLLFYALDFPEALRPGGLFDTLAHSHQFWHCAIVVAIALHWQALKGMYEVGLQGYSCTDRDPYEVQYFMKWFHRRDEL